MALKLVKCERKYERQIVEMLEEWTEYNKNHDDVNKTPWAIFKNDYHDFDYYMHNLEYAYPRDGKVPDSVFFLYDDMEDIMIGAINIRHYLNENLINSGHIGDGIRPSQRRKGYGTKMIAMSLEKCKELNIDRVLMVCDKTNIGSAKSIINNGGILEDEIEEDGHIYQRYWIDNN